MGSTSYRAWTVVLVLCLLAAPAQADTPSLWNRVTTGTQNLRSRDTTAILLTGAASAYLFSRTEDPDRSAQAIDASWFAGGIDTGDLYGSGLTVGALGLGLMAVGEWGPPAVGDAGRDLLASFALAGASTWAIKVSAGRQRPNGGPHSFPSGHTAAAFATVPIAYEYGGRWVGLAATALAVGTAAARMEDQRHYLSDVTFGAALGLAAGQAVLGNSIPWAVVKDRMLLSAKGVGLRVRF